jgi:predicted GNAT superfamily acetyltransferase
MHVSPVVQEFALDPILDPLCREDIHFEVLRRLPRNSPEDRAFLASLYDQAARIQGPCWNEPPFEWVPPHCLQAADSIGASTLVAYVLIDAEGRLQGTRPRLVGMIFEMPAFDFRERENRPILVPFLYSHLMAVSENGGDLGIGHGLKQLQRKEALSKGITTIRWTFDPLQSRNANITIRKCGAISRTYKQGAYDLVGINSGVDADRFYVTWDLASGRVQERMEAPTLAEQDRLLQRLLEAVPCVNETIVDRDQPGLRVNARRRFDCSEPVLALEIPINFQDMILSHASFAQRWRQETRALFEGYFQGGYSVRDFVMKSDIDIPGKRRAYYILEKGLSRP